MGEKDGHLGEHVGAPLGVVSDQDEKYYHLNDGTPLTIIAVCLAWGYLLLAEK